VTTLKDVAAAARVSLATAARVLREDPTLTVRPATRERVTDAAVRLGYRPNRVASGLRTRRTRTIAVVLPDPQNLAWSEMLRGIERAAASHDYIVVVADAHGPTLDPDLLGRFVLEGRMDGLLVAFATIEDALVDQIVGRGLPLLPINSRADNVPGSVTMDDATASGLAVDHLAELGHRRIGFVAGRSDTDVGRRRERGFREAMGRRGLPLREAWVVRGDYTARTAELLAPELFAAPTEDRPTAVLTVNLQSALGLLSAGRTAGVRFPGDLSLVTIDDHPILDHVDPPLTAINLPMAEMGEAGAELLIDVVGGGMPRHVVTQTPPRLVVRASTRSMD
jgi:LacI family transcriptional regulator